VEVEGLDETLSGYLSNNLPENLASLSPGARLDRVTEVEIDVLGVTKEAIHVAGAGVAEIDLERGGGTERDGFEAGDSFPFSFDVILSHDLRIKEVHRMDLDTSANDE
jgi:hypothetical protein